MLQMGFKFLVDVVLQIIKKLTIIIFLATFSNCLNAEEVKKLEAFLKNIEQKSRLKNDNKKTNPK